MLHDQMRRAEMLKRCGGFAVLIFTAAVCGCDSSRPFGDTILDGLGTAGKATVGGLETAGRATVGSLQWVADGGETGIRGRDHGLTAKPMLLVTGLRFPGIKLEELTVMSVDAVDGKGAKLAVEQGSWERSKHGPTLTLTVQPGDASETVNVKGVLIYRNGRWTLAAKSVRIPGDPKTKTGPRWKTESLNVIRQ